MHQKQQARQDKLSSPDNHKTNVCLTQSILEIDSNPGNRTFGW